MNTKSLSRKNLLLETGSYFISSFFKIYNSQTDRVIRKNPFDGFKKLKGKYNKTFRINYVQGTEFLKSY